MKDWLLRYLRHLVPLRHRDRSEVLGPRVPHDSRWSARRLPNPSGQTIWLFAGGCFAEELACQIRVAKYAGHWPSVLALRSRLAAATQSGFWTLRPLLIPMPSDPKRLGQRGFHLPVEIAKHLGQLTGCSVDRTALVKPRHTPEQASLGREKRLSNLAGRFRASVRLQGRLVVLVDDVLTTGASFVAARQAVTDVGAEVIAGVVLADARPGSSMMQTSGADDRPKRKKAPKPRPKPIHPPD